MPLLLQQYWYLRQQPYLYFLYFTPIIGFAFFPPLYPFNMALEFCIVQGCSRCDEFFPKENGRCAQCNHPMSTHRLSEGTELQPEVTDLCNTKSPTPSPLKVQSQHSTHALIASDVLGSTLQEAREHHKKASKGKGSAACKEVKTIQRRGNSRKRWIITYNVVWKSCITPRLLCIINGLSAGSLY